MLWRTPIAGPDPHFLLQLELESGRSKGRTDEAEAVFGRADYRHPEGGRGGCGDDGSLPEARHVEPDLLCVEGQVRRSEEHTSELQSLMRRPYAVFCLKKKNKNTQKHRIT